ncbi:E3 ubiquitin-protein ligase NRDP1-like [Actinia tenebrosa]|uniref:E3 ubiquitin-protein ligase NRDP1-like n=1 Tax=Actinia tenebrosa TaxID=6105 RepID=A0A6P8I8J1_ACTTE|nr:E3 ubiquitin-protein ligase NRDP1-like [Actinia tenebrosa]
MASATPSEEDIVNRFDGCNNSPGCFEESRFESHIKQEYLCPVGKGVLNNPKKVPCCGQVFCHFCIKNSTPYIENDQGNNLQQQSLAIPNYQTLKCPLCRKEFEANKLDDVCLNFKTLLNELRIKCSFEECRKVILLENMLHHQFGCEWNPERKVSCTDCNKELPYSSLKDHFCNDRVLRKYADVEKKTQEIKHEANKQEKMLEELLE